jgi:glycosyltransferase involved in cell wall biosynthesis
MGPEGLPITSLEAMAHGLPCIFSDLPVHHEITDHGKGAYLFRSGESESLLAGLRDLLASRDRRSTYAAEAYRIVASRYNEGSAREAYLRVFAG